MVATDGVFSMDGDIAPLDWLSAVCEANDAWLLSDDAHGVGVLAEGRGSAALFPEAQIPFQMGTLSKALGSYGGYVCASQAVVDLIEDPGPHPGLHHRPAAGRARAAAWRRWTSSRPSRP